jgi:hypothetical protein
VVEQEPHQLITFLALREYLNQLLGKQEPQLILQSRLQLRRFCLAVAVRLHLVLELAGM